MANIKAFAGIARVPFLLLPVTLVASGAAAAAYDGAFDLSRTVVALIGLVALHIAVNVLNEWGDMRTGIDLHTERTPFSGGSGTLPSGAVSTRTALVFGLMWAAIGLVTGIWLLAKVGWALVPIMVLGAVFVLGYTDLLARSGIGEVAAGLGLGGLPVIGTALVQDGTVGPAAVAAAVPATLMTFNLLLLNEFPDEQADRAGGRKNLVIMLGRPKAAAVYSVAALMTPSAIVGGVIAAILPPLSLAAVLPSFLLVKPLRWAYTNSRESVPIPALGANVMWILLTNLVLAVSLGIHLVL
ncbi:MAG: prenyltransferase [Gemmatimonadota bacterium]|nr:MAG: prenyltransferase [Gemmatimonadota bacterium]